MKWRWLPLSTRSAEALERITGRVTTLPVSVLDDRAAAGEDDEIAVLEIADRAGEGRERNRVGAEIHLAVAIADGERRAAPGADQEILLAGKQEGEREGALEPRQRRGDRRDRAGALLHLVGDEMRHHLGVGLGRELGAAAIRARRAIPRNSR